MFEQFNSGRIVKVYEVEQLKYNNGLYVLFKHSVLPMNVSLSCIEKKVNSENCILTVEQLSHSFLQNMLATESEPSLNQALALA